MMDNDGNELPVKLTDEEERIASAVVRKLSGTRFVAPEQHYKHHTWIEARMEAEEKWKARSGRWVDTIAGGVGIALVLAFMTWFGHLMLTNLASLLQKLTNGG